MSWMDWQVLALEGKHLRPIIIGLLAIYLLWGIVKITRDVEGQPDIWISMSLCFNPKPPKDGWALPTYLSSIAIHPQGTTSRQPPCCQSTCGSDWPLPSKTQPANMSPSLPVTGWSWALPSSLQTPVRRSSEPSLTNLLGDISIWL